MSSSSKAKVAEAPQPPQWPTEEAKRIALQANNTAYLHHMTRGRVHSDNAVNRSQDIERLVGQIAQAQAEVERLERERAQEAQAARVEHEMASAFAVMLQSVGEPLPAVEMPVQAAPAGQGPDWAQHKQAYGTPETGSFALPDPVCPSCGGAMVVDPKLGPIHPYPDGPGYVAAGENCRRQQPEGAAQ